MPRRQPGVTKYTTSDGRTFWQYVVDLGDDPDTGKRRQRRKRGFATQADASAALDEARRAIEAGGFLFDVEHMTFIEYLEHWLEGLPQTDMKPRTISDYRNETRRYIKPHLGDVKLTKLTPLHLERLYRTLMAEGGRGGRPLSPKTVLRVHRVIRKAIGDAERKGILHRNVARLADKPSTAQLDTERPAWTPDELRTFLAAAEGDELFALYRLAALTGMRRSELCGLRWEDVSLADQTVRVRQTLGVTNGVPGVSTPKSRRSRRVIDIDDRTSDIMRAHYDQQREAAEFVGHGWTETGYVFTTVIGTPQHPDNVSKRFVALVRTLEVRYLTLHGLRHTHATHLLAMGKNPRMVSERLGHADVAFTLQVYGHVLPGHQREAAEAAAGLVDE
ncbi:MAG: tyrosine-type recombinase/integrase [Acidimicrobiales bacterium]